VKNTNEIRTSGIHSNANVIGQLDPNFPKELLFKLELASEMKMISPMSEMIRQAPHRIKYVYPTP
jgi:hypothetical protein